jgi:hypothetical protein
MELQTPEFLIASFEADLRFSESQIVSSIAKRLQCACFSSNGLEEEEFDSQSISYSVNYIAHDAVDIGNTDGNTRLARAMGRICCKKTINIGTRGVGEHEGDAADDLSSLTESSFATSEPTSPSLGFEAFDADYDENRWDPERERRGQVEPKRIIFLLDENGGLLLPDDDYSTNSEASSHHLQPLTNHFRSFLPNLQANRRPIFPNDQKWKRSRRSGTTVPNSPTLDSFSC